MPVDVWLWFLKVLLKFALLGVPAGGILWYWKRRDIRSKPQMYASVANLGCYLLWITVVLTMLLMQESSALRPMINPWFPRYVFVVFPLLAAVVSLGLFISGIVAGSGERRFVFSANGLMLILWTLTIVAPN